MFHYKVDKEISLKLVMIQDAEEVFEMIDRSRIYLKEWLGWITPSYGVEETRVFADINLKRFANNEGLDTAIVYQGKIVGKIGLTTINWSNKTAHIGYMLDETYRGKGIMTRAANTIVDIAFNEYQLNKVEIHVAEGNQKSRNIPIRLGFKQEGIIRSAEWLYDHFVDHVVYGLLRDEWVS